MVIRKIIFIASTFIFVCAWSQDCPYSSLNDYNSCFDISESYYSATKVNIEIDILSKRLAKKLKGEESKRIQTARQRLKSK